MVERRSGIFNQIGRGLDRLNPLSTPKDIVHPRHFSFAITDIPSVVEKIIADEADKKPITLNLDFDDRNMRHHSSGIAFPSPDTFLMTSNFDTRHHVTKDVLTQIAGGLVPHSSYKAYPHTIEHNTHLDILPPTSAKIDTLTRVSYAGSNGLLRFALVHDASWGNDTRDASITSATALDVTNSLLHHLSSMQQALQALYRAQGYTTPDASHPLIFTAA